MNDSGSGPCESKNASSATAPCPFKRAHVFGAVSLKASTRILRFHSGVPVRELFGLAAAVVPLFALRRVRAWGFDTEQTLVLLGGLLLLSAVALGRSDGRRELDRRLAARMTD